MLLRIISFLTYAAVIASLAETGRVPWLAALPAIIAGLAVLIYFPRIKEVKLAGAEIKLFEKQAEAISKAQIDAITAQAEVHKTELKKLADKAAESESRLEKIRLHLYPRYFDRDKLVELLEGLPKGEVKIQAVVEDADSVMLSCFLRDGLLAAGWKVQHVFIPMRDIVSGACQGQPQGITVATDAISEEERAALQHLHRGEGWIKTPFTVLLRIMRQLNLVGVTCCYPNDCAKGAGLLRLVVAPKVFADHR